MKSEPKTGKVDDVINALKIAHDRFVYLVWTNVVFAKMFLTRFLNPVLLRLIDLDSLELAPTQTTTPEGANSIGDVYYKFRFKSGKRGVLVLIIEHKSDYDRFVSFQILRYEVGVLDYMRRRFDAFADESGRLPIPYSILLCTKSCPQFDDLTVRCEDLDYGVRTSFQEINVNKIDFDALLDAPLLRVALGLTRFSSYDDKENRQGELLDLFRSLTDIDPTKDENLKETWKFIFDVSLNYVSRLMRDTSFNMTRFRYELYNAEGDEMKSQLYDDVFEAFFADKVQPYKDAVAVAEAELAEVKFQRQEAEIQRQEAEERAKIVEDFFYSGMYDMIYETLCKRCNLSKVPDEIVNKLEKIKSYAFLRKLWRIADAMENNYAEFLTALEKNEE